MSEQDRKSILRYALPILAVLLIAAAATRGNLFRIDDGNASFFLNVLLATVVVYACRQRSTGYQLAGSFMTLLLFLTRAIAVPSFNAEIKDVAVFLLFSWVGLIIAVSLGTASAIMYGATPVIPPAPTEEKDEE